MKSHKKPQKITFKDPSSLYWFSWNYVWEGNIPTPRKFSRKGTLHGITFVQECEVTLYSGLKDQHAYKMLVEHQGLYCISKSLYIEYINDETSINLLMHRMVDCNR